VETNEQMKSVLRAAVCEELEQFFTAIQTLDEGELAHLEAQVVKTSQALGRILLEGVLTSRRRQRRPAAQRTGSCGHRQRLVGERPKDLLTLVGTVRFVSPYYSCLGASEQNKRCRHGEAPDDALWGVQERRTTGGVQQQISCLCGRLTFEEAAETFYTPLRPPQPAQAPARRRSTPPPVSCLPCLKPRQSVCYPAAHTCTVPSAPPEAMRVPSGDQATASTAAVWPR